MRTVIGLLLIVLLLPGCQKTFDQASLSGPLCGTWHMLNATYSGQDLEVTVSAEERTCYKLMSGKHFAVIEMYKANPDSQFFAAVGTYDMTDSTYTEFYEASNSPTKPGTQMTFHYKLDGDTWIIENRSGGLYMIETWELVSKPVLADAGM